MDFSNVPLSDRQLAELLERVAAVGGFIVADATCGQCQEKYLYGIPSERQKKYPAQKKQTNYATVCLVCDHAYKIPKLLVDSV